MTTLDILRELQSQVGSRRAGTDGERRAQAWLETKCRELGLAVERDDFTFIGSESFRPLFQLAIMIWVAASIGLSFLGQPVVGALAFVLLFVYVTFVHNHVDVRLARSRSQNILGGLRRPLSDYADDPAGRPGLLICAHYDTPRNTPAWMARLRSPMRFLAPLAILGLLLFALFTVLRGVGWLVGRLGSQGLGAFFTAAHPWVGGLVLVMVVPFMILLVINNLQRLLARKTDSPGADDNGSGTAVVLDLARRMKEHPPENVEVFVAWWGAEELGLFGSRQFVRRFHTRLDKDRFHVLNVDCVGVGELLTVYTGQGVFRRRSTDPAVLERIERTARELGVRTVRTWQSVISGGSSDHAEWVDRGFRLAVPFLRENDRPLSLPARVLAAVLRIPDASQLSLDHVHTARDTVDHVDPHVLQQTADMIEAYVRAVDAELGV